MKTIVNEPEVLPLSLKLFNQALRDNIHRDKEIQQGIEGERKHVKEVLKWVKKLDKNPSLSLKIAALFHDIDRVVTPGVEGGFKGDRKSKAYLLHKRTHAKRGANYTCKKLKECSVDTRIIDRVRFLIEHHDDTLDEVQSFSDKELEILVAADSLSWLASTGPTIYRKEGNERAKDKLKFMINKLPKFARKILITLPVENKTMDRLKTEVLRELDII